MMAVIKSSPEPEPTGPFLHSFIDGGSTKTGQPASAAKEAMQMANPTSNTHAFCWDREKKGYLDFINHLNVPIPPICTYYKSNPHQHKLCFYR
jgi:hypothetical protein